MKKSFLFLSLFFVITLISCKKDHSLEDISVTANASVKENGYIWPGWEISNPPSKFDAIADRIYLEDSAYNDAGIKLRGKDLPNTGKRIVYAVRSFTPGNFNNMKADLERRGWKIAPMSYLLALNKEYGGYWNNIIFWNLYCLDIPAKINFGSGDELAAVHLNGNINPQGNLYSNYNVSLQFIPFTSLMVDPYILVYR